MAYYVSDLYKLHKEAKELYNKTFAHKEFILHQDEVLPPNPVQDAYVDEETKFVKIVRKVPVIKVQKFECYLKPRSL